MNIGGPVSNRRPLHQPCRQVNRTMGEVHVAIEPVGGNDPGGLSVCRTPLGLMLSGVTSKEEFLSFPSSARPGKGSARPPNGGRHRERAGGELRAVHRGTDWRRQGGAGGSAVRGPHAKINCSLGDSFTGENSCMASGQLTQPALMRMRRMQPTSLARDKKCNYLQQATTRHR